MEKEKKKKSDIFGPREIRLLEVVLSSLGGFVAGIAGSIVLVMLVFLIGGGMEIATEFEQSSLGFKGNPAFPFLLSIIAFVTITITNFITYFFLVFTDSDKYKNTYIHLAQIGVYMILTFVLITPLYIYVGVDNYENIMYIFIFHVLFTIFGISLILEILNNYRYVLIGLYGNLIGFFITVFISMATFSMFSSGFAKLLSLLIIPPLVNFLMIFFRGIFELLYYKYYEATGHDQLGDIFYQIEETEKEALREATEDNMMR